MPDVPNQPEPVAPDAELTDLDEQRESSRKLFGTFSGVFTPTLLTILGVIMFLRQGWVVGNAGLGGASLIILLAFTITGCTGLALSSITTNIRIGAGGAFSIISQSLGLEVGGSIGIPLYLSQALAVSMYIFGFRAGWLWVFPTHSPLVVDLVLFAVLFGIAYVSAGLAFKIQYVILAIIAVALVSVGVAAWRGSMTEPVQWWGDFGAAAGNEPVSFWVVFAVFFPASTGIMAGANMSGELRNPRRSIPIGTMSAILLSLLVYLALSYWLARSASTTELQSNYTIMIDKAAWGPPVVLGLLGATFSSALSSLVGAPRILQALGTHHILPFGNWFAKRSAGGEPRNALILTGAITFVALMLRDLNAVAPLITLFFLITYATINAVVLIEQNLGLISFRPLFRVPRLVPLLGAAGCLVTMFIVNPTFSIVALLIVVGLHAALIRRHLKAPFGDVRSGLFVAIAEWAAKKADDLTASRERTWKANLLVPAESTNRIQALFQFARDISYPKGFLKLVGLTSEENQPQLAAELEELTEDFREEKVFAAWTVITAATFGDNLQAGIETFGSAFFSPNILLMSMPENPERETEVRDILQVCEQNHIGAMLLHKTAGDLQEPSAVTVWFTEQKNTWELGMDLGNQDLALLAGYKLKQNWNATLRLAAVVDSTDRQADARKYLELVAETARIPNARIATAEKVSADDAPDTDLNVVPIHDVKDLDSCRRHADNLGTACLFTLDSGNENALA